MLDAAKPPPIQMTVRPSSPVPGRPFDAKNRNHGDGPGRDRGSGPDGPRETSIRAG